MADEIILETRGLIKEFKGFVAVNGVDLRVKRGQIHALIGPNGAGKTTLLQLLVNLLQPSAGTANVLGVDSRRLRVGERLLDRVFGSLESALLVLHVAGHPQFEDGCGEPRHCKDCQREQQQDPHDQGGSALWCAHRSHDPEFLSCRVFVTSSRRK